MTREQKKRALIEECTKEQLVDYLERAEDSERETGKLLQDEYQRWFLLKKEIEELQRENARLLQVAKTWREIAEGYQQPVISEQKVKLHEALAQLAADLARGEKFAPRREQRS